jgi:broad specificity phosphatase PhoE
MSVDPRSGVRLALLICLALGALATPARADHGPLWQALRSGGHVALIRHALAPGGGDPTDMTIGDCTTQRNLSEEGRAQARRIGALFRANGIAAASVFSSQWCRCLETARLMALGAVTEAPLLNSLHNRASEADVRSRATRAWIAAQDPARPLVLVTHQANISALVDAFPSSGEIIVVRWDRGDWTLTGRIPTE